MSPRVSDEEVKASAGSVRWDLSALFSGPDDARIAEVLEQTLSQSQQFQSRYKERISELSAVELSTALQEKEALLRPYYTLSQYVHLLYSVDLSDEEVKALVAKVEETGSEIANALLFFDLELSQVSESQFQALSAEFSLEGDLHAYAYPIRRTVEKARYRFSEKEEQMVNIKDLTGTDAFRKLYTELTSSFQYDFEMDGELKRLNGSELRALRQHGSAQVRREAMDLFFSRYESEKLVLAHCYNSIVKDFNLERKKRGYESPISVMNTGNDLPDEAIQLLHEVTTASYPMVQRYYKLKKEILGLDELSLADIYAPMPEAEQRFTWDEAMGLVQDSFTAFDSEFGDMAARLIREKRVDAPVEPTKRGGAYCSSAVPELGPFVFLNFMGQTRDVSTIAHEFGHAIHAFYSEKLPLVNYHAILPLCETASVFSEMVLMDYLKGKMQSKGDRIALLTDKLEDLFATSHRQNMFSRFEMQCHEQISEGLMTATELSALYMSELKLMFGDSVNYSDAYQWEWSSIPHIFEVPFYVHSYNFGNLLVLALYQQYLEEGDSFIPKLKQVLSLGSSASPVEICQIVGADICDRAFWEKSMRFMEGMVSELEELIHG